MSSESTLGLLSESARELAVVTGNPVRPEVLSGQADRAVQALGLSGFDRWLPTVYVTGEAQGSQQINELVGESAQWLLQRANVIHQCGPANEAGLRARAAGLPAELAARYYLAGFVGGELPDVLALADVVLSRRRLRCDSTVQRIGSPDLNLQFLYASIVDPNHTVLPGRVHQIPSCHRQALSPRPQPGQQKLLNR